MLTHGIILFVCFTWGLSLHIPDCSETQIATCLCLLTDEFKGIWHYTWPLDIILMVIYCLIIIIKYPFSALLKSLYHVKIYHYYRHYFEVESYYAAHADNLWACENLQPEPPEYLGGQVCTTRLGLLLLASLLLLLRINHINNEVQNIFRINEIL